MLFIVFFLGLCVGYILKDVTKVIVETIFDEMKKANKKKK